MRAFVRTARETRFTVRRDELFLRPQAPATGTPVRKKGRRGHVKAVPAVLVFARLCVCGADCRGMSLHGLDYVVPAVYAYYVDETGDEMAMGNAAMALVYSGEAAYAMELNDDLSYSVPEEGSNLWIDSWFMPKSCHNTEYAEKFLDFLCREDIGMLNFDYVYYATPNLAVKENLDEETLSDTTIFPTDETLANCEVYKQYDIDTTKLSNYLWKKLKSE